ncbi:hypothetical protein DMC25_08550 [Caulobacter sp. D4A]|uniref:hypothetical protein n=1 Tax=unclassified Caulobacter TaxID=2648921 RepID=UPI000D73FCD9|nr:MULTISPECIES: hypothetical protein [unclassified Caulobacter]PXA89982.1 hypothetical protein DMC25_08550 [Caulobacter sp. D4A]PXA95006.1 hypothetical protein DMC18_05025 [Caulobacter sp. D5]
MSARLARRTLVAAAVLTLAAGSVALAQGNKVAPADKVFGYLENFLKVPAQERSRTRVAYRVTRDGKPAEGLKAMLVDAGGARTPLPISADGRFERLPTLAQLQGGAKVEFDAPADAKFGSTLIIEPVLKPAAEYEAGELKVVLDSTNGVIGRAAGPMAMLAPKMTGFSFPGASGGVVVGADGKTQALPLAGKAPIYRLSDFKGATRIRLSGTPSQVRFIQSKK